MDRRLDQAAVVDALVRVDLAREDRSPLGAEVALDREQDRALAGPDHGQGIGAQMRVPGHPDQRPLGHPGGETQAALGIACPEVRREHVVGGEAVDHRRHGLGGDVVQLRLAVGPDRSLEGDPGRPGQPIRVPPAGPLAVGRPEPGQEAVFDQARQASLGDAPVAVDEQRRELGRHDVAVHEPEQEAPVALGQRRPGRDS
ncbi:MAG: hypothetical protein ABIR11_06875 [Candidatus Limnocylindrales bacterium]